MPARASRRDTIIIPKNGPATTRRAWIFQRPNGIYQNVTAWSGATTWLENVETEIHAAAGKHARDQRGHIAPDTVLRVARVIATACDRRTGRDLALANATVGLRASVGERTAERALAVLTDLGYLVTVIRGRYLTAAERIEAAALHGGRQLKAASIRALTVPRRCTQTVEIGDLPRKGLSNLSTHVGLNSPTRAKARSGAASRPQRRKQTHQTTDKQPPYPLEVLRMAGQLQSKLPWLAKARASTRQICKILNNIDLDYNLWTAADVLACLDAWHQRHNWFMPTTVKNPLGWLTTLLKRCVGAAKALEWKTIEQRAQEHEQHRIQRETERASRQAEAANYTPPSQETLRMVAQMKERLQAKQSAHRLNSRTMLTAT